VPLIGKCRGFCIASRVATVDSGTAKFGRDAMQKLGNASEKSRSSGEAIVAIHGSKFKAVNNRDKNFTDRKLKARVDARLDD
jgi:hypothetical protein